MRIVMLGAPGAGKGTQAKKISEKFDVPHISTGDILRKEIKKGTEAGLKARENVESGKLVSDDLIIDIIENFIKDDSIKEGFIMDGFPRNTVQAKKFMKMLEKNDSGLDKVVNIVVDYDELIQRLGSRRICVKCHHITSINGNQGKRCPECGGRLVRREDDREEVIRKRLEVYEEQTRPLIEYYRKRGILVNIKGNGREEEVTERILNNL
jgi:adenylate kinase